MDFKSFSIALLKDARFWIAFFFILHLSRITLPPLEPGSTWRQTDGLMIARNFYEGNSNILYPTVDVAGERSGVVGCEFPILNYLIYLVSLVFGYESWYGRLINLIVSSIGVFFFFKLIRHYFNQEVAFNAVILVLISIWFTYNRTNIPDTFAVSLCMIALFYATQFLEHGKIYQLMLVLLLGGLGCLSKISAASVLTVLAIPYFLGSALLARKIWIGVVALLIIASVYWWYFVWVPHLSKQYGFGEHFFMGLPFNEGLEDLLENWKLTLKRFYDTAFKYTGFFIFLIGLYFILKKKQWLQLAVFAVPFLAYTIVVLKSGYGFHVNQYYVVMYVPPMAFVGGWGLSQLNKKFVAIALLAVAGIEGVANQVHVMRIREPNSSFVKLEAVLDSVSKRGDLIAINGSAVADPTPMYFAHRKGWVFTTPNLINSDNLNYVRSNGCKYAVIVKQLYGDAELSFPVVYDSEYFKVYKIQ